MQLIIMAIPPSISLVNVDTNKQRYFCIFCGIIRFLKGVTSSLARAAFFRLCALPFTRFVFPPRCFCFIILLIPWRKITTVTLQSICVVQTGTRRFVMCCSVIVRLNRVLKIHFTIQPGFHSLSLKVRDLDLGSGPIIPTQGAHAHVHIESWYWLEKLVTSLHLGSWLRSHVTILLLCIFSVRRRWCILICTTTTSTWTPQISMETPPCIWLQDGVLVSQLAVAYSETSLGRKGVSVVGKYSRSTWEFEIFAFFREYRQGAVRKRCIEWRKKQTKWNSNGLCLQYAGQSLCPLILI